VLDDFAMPVPAEPVAAAAERAHERVKLAA
jgi:hypothetical protein